MSAALTPRVRILAVCDEAVRSEIEEGVFSLEGVRQSFHAETFPCIRTLAVYLLLTYSRAGRFDGRVKLVNDRNEKTIRYGKFTATFADGSDRLALAVDMDNNVFPDPGMYSVKVEFWSETGDVLKAEQPFHVWQLEE